MFSLKMAENGQNTWGGVNTSRIVLCTSKYIYSPQKVATQKPKIIRVTYIQISSIICDVVQFGRKVLTLR